MFGKAKNIVNSLLRQNGFTLVETMISIVIVSVVILSLVATATFSLNFSRVEKARTLAQDISRNVMSQQIRTVKFDELKDLVPTGTDVHREVIFRNVSGLPKKNSLNKTSSLSDDLNRLQNALCEVVIRKMEDEKQLDVKVRVLWELNKDGSEGNKTKLIELSTIVSDGDMNLKRAAKLAEKTEGIKPSNSGCDPACSFGQVCNAEKQCVSLTCNECIAGSPGCSDGCNSSQSCVLGVCQDNSTCSNCTGENQVCISGQCITKCIVGENNCSGTQTCIDGTCQDATACTGNGDCATTHSCQNGFCKIATCGIPGLNQVCEHGELVEASCPSEYACPLGYNCESGKCILPEAIKCTNCKKHEICVLGKCVDECSVLVGKPSGCACNTHLECKNETCKSQNKKCL